MLGTRRTRSIVPRGDDQNVYLVVDDLGRVHPETDAESQDKSPVRIVDSNTAEKWSRDVSADVAHELRATNWRGSDDAIQSIFSVVKAPLGWSIYSDGVKLGGVYGSKEAAFEAATIAAMFAVRDGAGVQINVPSAGEERHTGQSYLHDPTR